MSTLPLTLVILAAASGSTGCTRGDASAPANWPEVVAEVEADLHSLYEQIAGSVEERRAYEFLRYEQLQSEAEACMAREGVAYAVPPYFDIYAGMADLGLPDPYPEAGEADPAKARRRGFGLATYASEPPPPTFAVEAGHDAAAATCEKVFENAPGGLPDFVEPLHGELFELVGSAVTFSGARQKPGEYAACLATFGFSAESQTELVVQLSAAFGPFVAAVGTTNAHAARSGAEWDAAVQQEIDAAVADAQCRHDAHARAMAALRTGLKLFRAGHEGEIEAVRAQWASLVARASTERVTWAERHPEIAASLLG